jgi:hypothetical protein
MNSITKKLGALALGSLLTGSVFAGPAGAYSNGGFASQVVGSTAQPPVTLIALFRSGTQAPEKCPMIKAQTKQVNTGATKGQATTTTVVTGYKHEGCVHASNGTVVCKDSKQSCSEMLQGH